MPYTPVTFVDGVTPLNATTMNKLEDGVEATTAVADAAIPKALVDAKGDILVATGDNVPARLPVGANTQALLADSTQATGLKWGVAGAALTYEGDHVGATSYDDGDIVVKDGIAYLCVGGPTTSAPNPVPWGPAGMMGGYIKTTDKGVANGVATLGANARQPVAQMPKIGAFVRRTTVQSIPAGGGATAFPIFNDVNYDTDGCWSAAAPERLTCKTAGLYLIHACLGWALNANGIRDIAIAVNGGLSIVDDLRQTLPSGFGPRQNVSTVYPLAVGEYVVIACYQDSGGPLDTQVNGAEPNLGMVLVG